VTGPPIYEARETGQIRDRGGTPPFSLEIHELRDDGRTFCGNMPVDWTRKTMDLERLGQGAVTCKACARFTGH
jgi:hypothetical protein